MILGHNLPELIHDWARDLKIQAENVNFDFRYAQDGHLLGSGTFSKVY